MKWRRILTFGKFTRQTHNFLLTFHEEFLEFFDVDIFIFEIIILIIITVLRVIFDLTVTDLSFSLKNNGFVSRVVALWPGWPWAMAVGLARVGRCPLLIVICFQIQRIQYRSEVAFFDVKV